MISLTDAARNAVATAIAGSTGQVEGLRLSVEAGGCAGFKYQLGLVATGQPDDVTIDSDGLKLFVDPPSLDLLNGTVVDFVVALEGSGFTFDNPNAGSRCSCGKSFG